MTWHTIKTVALTLVAVLTMQLIVVGVYLSQAPKLYTCTKIEL